MYVPCGGTYGKVVANALWWHVGSLRHGGQAKGNKGAGSSGPEFNANDQRKLRATSGSESS